MDSNIESATELALLAAQLGGENAQRYLDAYINRALNSEDVLRQAPASLLFDILERQPTLLGRAILSARLDHIGLINRAIARLSADQSLLTAAVSAMMTAQAWTAVAAAVEQFGASALKLIFDVIDHKTQDCIDYPDSLYSIIWSQPSVVNIRGCLNMMKLATCL